jgi:16S rRNA processing protein RimM
MRPDDLRTVGVVVGVHGLQGTLRVAPLSDFPERFAVLHTVYLMRGETVLGAREVKRVKWMKDVLLITLREVTKREEAEELRGVEICVPESEAWQLPENVFYTHELIGFAVVGDDDAVIGTLTGVVEGAQDTLIVETPAGELLVPFVHEWVGEVNAERRTIEVLNWRRLAESEELPPSPDADDR